MFFFLYIWGRYFGKMFLAMVFLMAPLQRDCLKFIILLSVLCIYIQISKLFGTWVNFYAFYILVFLLQNDVRIIFSSSIYYAHSVLKLIKLIILFILIFHFWCVFYGANAYTLPSLVFIANSPGAVGLHRAVRGFKIYWKEGGQSSGNYGEYTPPTFHHISSFRLISVLPIILQI